MGVRSESWAEALAAADATRRRTLIEEARRALHLRDLLGGGELAVVALVLDEVRSLPLEAQLDLLERTEARLRVSALAGEGDLHLIGFPAAAGASFEVVRRGLTRALPLTGVVLAGLLVALYRSAWPAMIALGVGALSTVGAMGLSMLVDPRLTVPMGAAPVLILVLSLSSVLFVVQRASLGEEVVAAMERTGPACVLSALTTCLGFAALGMTPAPAIRMLGLAAALGVLWGLSLTLTAVPAALALLGHRLRPWPPLPGERAFLGRCCRLAAARPVPVLIVTLLLAAAGLASLPRLVVETDPVGRFATSHPLRRAIEVADRSLGGSVATDVVVRAGRSALTPPVIAALARFENAALEDPRVLASVSVTTPLRRVLELIHPEEGGELGPSEKRARQALFFLPAVDREHLVGLVGEGGSVLRVSLRTRSAGLLAHARLAEDLRALAQRELGELDARVEIEVTGLIAMLGEWLARLHQVQLRHLAALVLIVGLVLWLAFRSLSWVAIGLGANALPLLLFVAALSLLGLPFDSDYLMVLMIGLGVAIDDTMHCSIPFARSAPRPQPRWSRCTAPSTASARR
ncbi:MAG TPA: MMPL family transporter [Thermoanaerobaculia bacterium]|nr:MMPL family transporter [Thermoanaerobaculia bacterium]